MADKPILFSAPMVQAILREIREPGTGKTQTRRVLKPQPDASLPIGGADFVAYPEDQGRWCWLNGFDGSIIAPFDAPYAAGDRLWVREAWATSPSYDELKPSDLGGDESIRYAADGSWESWGWGNLGCIKGRNRPSMFMPRWASRITLEVTDVRVQRLQEISEADARAEGVEKDSDGWLDYQMPNTQCCASAVDSFRTLWDSLNADRAPWAFNPWVVAVTFRPHLTNIDQMEKAG